MKKILIATAVLMLPLAGCGEATTSTDGNVQNTQQAGQQEQTQEPVVNADTMLDQRIFSEATRGEDASKCDAIIDEGMKKECGQIVNAGLLTKDAIEKRDKGVCGGIELERYKEQCEVGVDEKVEEDRKEEKRKKADEKRLSIEQEAIESGDYSLCDKINNEIDRKSCMYNVVVNKVIQTGDDKLCSVLEGEDREICITSIE